MQSTTEAAYQGLWYSATSDHKSILLAVMQVKRVCSHHRQKIKQSTTEAAYQSLWYSVTSDFKSILLAVMQVKRVCSHHRQKTKQSTTEAAYQGLWYSATSDPKYILLAVMQVKRVCSHHRQKSTTEAAYQGLWYSATSDPKYILLAVMQVKRVCSHHRQKVTADFDYFTMYRHSRVQQRPRTKVCGTVLSGCVLITDRRSQLILTILLCIDIAEYNRGRVPRSVVQCNVKRVCSHHRQKVTADFDYFTMYRHSRVQQRPRTKVCGTVQRHTLSLFYWTNKPYDSRRSTETFPPGPGIVWSVRCRHGNDTRLAYWYGWQALDTS
ncbi:hypothetical protein J6590_012178 [Homalodisca vitripennis]|nr:hypothetical protein J6590_012178 [Homalodisca vitripennis]